MGGDPVWAQSSMVVRAPRRGLHRTYKHGLIFLAYFEVKKEPRIEDSYYLNAKKIVGTIIEGLSFVKKWKEKWFYVIENLLALIEVEEPYFEVPNRFENLGMFSLYQLGSDFMTLYLTISIF